jgi:hypothetical protein
MKGNTLLVKDLLSWTYSNVIFPLSTNGSMSNLLLFIKSLLVVIQWLILKASKSYSKCSKWIMLKQNFAEYRPLIVKMHVKSSKSDATLKNLNSLCDVELILGLPCILPMLECCPRVYVCWRWVYIQHFKFNENKLRNWLNTHLDLCTIFHI